MISDLCQEVLSPSATFTAFISHLLRTSKGLDKGDSVYITKKSPDISLTTEKIYLVVVYKAINTNHINDLSHFATDSGRIFCRCFAG